MRAVLVPVKSFRHAKLRLGVVLRDTQREQLAKDLAAHVIAAAKSAPAFVACDDGEVADFAVEAGAFVLWTPGLGLSGAVQAGMSYLATKDMTLVTVAHADLPLAESLDDLGSEDVITLAPDRHLDGTNVASIPTRYNFRFSYGPGSYLRHREEAIRLGAPLSVVHDWTLAADIDTPDDLSLFPSLITEKSLG